MVRKLKFGEKKLLKKVDFINWELDNNLHEANVMRKFHLKTRQEYTAYNKLSREIREVARKIRDDLSPKDSYRTIASSNLINKLYDMGLIATKRSLELCDKVSASSFCRRRLPVVMVNIQMAESVQIATNLVEHGHVRVGPEVIMDPAFLITPNLQDFITWTNASAIRKHVMEYNDQRDDFDLLS